MLARNLLHLAAFQAADYRVVFHISFATVESFGQSYLSDASRSVRLDKTFLPNHSSNKGKSIGMHAAIITQFASILGMCQQVGWI